MTDLRQVLSDEQLELLDKIAAATGRSEDELIREAVEQYLQQAGLPERRERLRQARGMWRERTDLPDLRDLRGEWERTPISGGEPRG